MKVEIDGLRLELADSYADLNAAEQLDLVKLVVRRTGETVPDIFVFIEILEVLVKAGYAKKFRKMPFRKFWRKLKLSPEQLRFLELGFEWVYERPTTAFTHFDFENERFYVVKERFEHTSAAEFTEGLMDFIDLSKGDEGALNRLIANFCRPERADLADFMASDKWNGDNREKYNRQRAVDRSKSFDKLDAGVKVWFLWHYDALINAFFDEYEELFSGGGEKRYEDGRGYLMVLKNAAKNHYLGSFEAVQEVDVNVVYSLLLDDYYDSKERD